jgi:flagellar hook assembly protein FlgD
MKQLTFILIVVFPFLCFSQDMNVKKKGGLTESYALSSVKKITYSSTNCTMNIDGSSAKIYTLEEIGKISFANVICNVGINEQSNINTEKRLKNYPNPFSDVTTIEFELTEDATVQINIYNAQGVLIRNLVNSKSQKGNHKINWDGRNDEGNILSSGLYFCQLKMNKVVLTNKMFLIN